MRVPALISLVFLAACKTNIAVDIFASDVQTVVSTGEKLTTPMVIGLEVGGSDGCAKAEANLLEPMKAAYGTAEFIGCETGESFNTYARFRVAAELVHEISNQKSDSEQPMYIGAYRSDAGDAIVLEFFMNTESMDRFEKAVPSKFSFYMSEAPEYRLSATIANDLRDDIEVRVNDVFADGRPIQKGGTYTLPRRDEVKIVLSDVSNAAFGTTDTWVFIAEIPMPPE